MAWPDKIDHPLLYTRTAITNDTLLFDRPTDLGLLEAGDVVLAEFTLEGGARAPYFVVKRLVRFEPSF